MLYTQVRRVHEDTLGNLDSQQGWTDLRHAHRAFHHLDNGPLFELLGGDVDCDGHRPCARTLRSRTAAATGDPVMSSTSSTPIDVTAIKPLAHDEAMRLQAHELGRTLALLRSLDDAAHPVDRGIENDLVGAA